MAIIGYNLEHNTTLVDTNGFTDSTPEYNPLHRFYSEGDIVKIGTNICQMLPNGKCFNGTDGYDEDKLILEAVTRKLNIETDYIVENKENIYTAVKTYFPSVNINNVASLDDIPSLKSIDLGKFYLNREYWDNGVYYVEGVLIKEYCGATSVPAYRVTCEVTLIDYDGNYVEEYIAFSHIKWEVPQTNNGVDCSDYEIVREIDLHRRYKVVNNNVINRSKIDNDIDRNDGCLVWGDNQEAFLISRDLYLDDLILSNTLISKQLRPVYMFKENKFKPFDDKNLTKATFNSGDWIIFSADYDWNALSLSGLRYVGDIKIEVLDNNTVVETVVKNTNYTDSLEYDKTLLILLNKHNPSYKVKVTFLSGAGEIGTIELVKTIYIGLTDLEITHNIKDYNSYEPNLFGYIEEAKKPIYDLISLKLYKLYNEFDSTVEQIKALKGKFVTIDTTDYCLNGEYKALKSLVSRGIFLNPTVRTIKTKNTENILADHIEITTQFQEVV